MGKRKDAHGKRQGDRHHHHQRGAPAQRDERDQHQGKRNGKIRGQLVQPALDIQRLIKGRGELHIGRKRCVQRLHNNSKALAQVRCADSILLLDRNENGSLAIIARVMKLFGLRPLHLGDVAHRNETTRFPLDDRAPNGFQRTVSAPGINIEPTVSRINGARRDRCATCGNTIGNGGRGNAGFRQTTGVNRDAKFGFGQTKDSRRPDTGHDI